MLEIILKSIPTLITVILGIQVIIESAAATGLSRKDWIKIIFMIGSALTTIVVDYNSIDNDNRSAVQSNRDKIVQQQNLTSLKTQNKSLRKAIDVVTDTLKRKINQAKDSSAKMIRQLEIDNYALSKELTRSSIETSKRILGDGYPIFLLFGSAKQGG